MSTPPLSSPAQTLINEPIPPLNQKERIIDFNKIVDRKDLNCPISLKLMKNPVTTSCNHRFSKKYILRHLKNKLTCPSCNIPCSPKVNDDPLIRGIIENLKKEEEIVDSVSSEEGEEVTLPIHQNLPVIDPSRLFRANAMLQQNGPFSLLNQTREPTFKEQIDKIKTKFYYKINEIYMLGIADLSAFTKKKDETLEKFNNMSNAGSRLRSINEKTKLLEILNKIVEEGIKELTTFKGLRKGNSFSQ